LLPRTRQTDSVNYSRPAVSAPAWHARDLKPENMMIISPEAREAAGDDEWKIGLAKALNT
jgi:hypothetical protein